MSAFSIRNPYFIIVLCLVVIVLGVVAGVGMPVDLFPGINLPQVVVATFYSGMPPQDIEANITAPLERQFGQMPGLKQMRSSSSGGSSVITLEFSLDLNIDIAEQEVQAGINAATNLLPADLANPPVYSKVNPADAPIMTLALTSKIIPLPQVEDLADTRLAQKISQLSGVGLVSISGGQRPAVRIQANPTALASYGLTANTMTDFYLLHAEYDLNWHSFDVAGEYRILSQREANDAKVGYSAEVGYVLMQNVHVAVGYNFIGNKDLDLVSYTYWSRGPYVTMGVKFTEKILNYF